MKHRTAATAPATLLAAALLTLVTACGYEEGPPGRVIDKKRTYTGMGAEINELTVRTSDGEEETFFVTRDDYDSCYRGSSYPACTER
ncbi:hypothetical protein ACFV7R_17665 [Streptomyces sp. NPDC059866]|uniref:hypothetical protein n=1 Tax=Streptomyces sp. NPDC059866 TaxID=3346978 RepID=UPI003667ED74